MDEQAERADKQTNQTERNWSEPNRGEPQPKTQKQIWPVKAPKSW